MDKKICFCSNSISISKLSGLLKGIYQWIGLVIIILSLINIELQRLGWYNIICNRYVYEWTTINELSKQWEYIIKP